MKNRPFSLILLLTLILSLVFSSCGGEGTSTAPTSSEAVNSSTPSTSSDSSTEPLPPDPVETILHRLTFVSINDLHGYIEQEENGTGGLSNTAYAIDTLSRYFNDDDEATTTRDDIVLFANGDMFQGTALSNITKGKAVIAAMNEMGFDGMGVGNHEFDWGLDVIFDYWDNDPANGEANFPLISSNIRHKEKNSLVADLDTNDAVLAYTMVEKEGVKVGIIAAIGPCENSILQTRLTDYSFDSVVSSVKNAALALDAAGADLISVNIHYGDTKGVTSYKANGEIAELKNAEGEYLVDVIFNGHTHSMQTGDCRRSDGSMVPVVQAGSYNEALGYVKLIYNEEEDRVIGYECKTLDVDSVGTKYDAAVEKAVDDYAEKLDDELATLAVSDVTVRSKSALYNYVADIMVKAFDADYAISNTGGLRGGGGIEKGKPITEANLYEIIPFDNEVYFVTIKGSALYQFYTEQGDYYFFGKKNSAPAFNALQNSDQEYTLAIIDYVYTSQYFTGKYGDYTPFISSTEETHLCLRDLLVLDVALYGEAGLAWNPNQGARITKQSWH